MSRDSESDAGDPWSLEITVSQSTNARIFDLTQRAHYFDGQIDSGRKNLAFTGSKTLAYKNGSKSTQATYNYSAVPSIQELTALFQSLSTTLEIGRRLDYFLRYQKLALDAVLKQMEDSSKSGGLESISSVVPILQKIADDPSVIKVARARAQRLLQLAEAGSK